MTRGFLSDGLPASWSGGEVVEAVVEHIRADPCNHPDASTARATLTTVDGAREILAERWDPTARAANDATSDSTPVWLVEVQGDIPVIGGLRGVSECDHPPSGEERLVFYIVGLDGEIQTGFATNYP